MCGITGHFSKANPVNKTSCLSMLKAIQHRGPDDSGNYFENRVFLGHQRLSIIDLTERGHQPMWNLDKTIGIVYNGEIYNFKEIKTELSEFQFQSETDTEVIIYAYQKWGIEKAIRKFNGMFSFCIYDKKQQKAFFVRDRIGIKPFVYYWDKQNLIFASELKAILQSDIVSRNINPSAVYNYFIYRYVGHPHTIFENICKLTPGHYLELDLNTFKLKEETYWQLFNHRYLEMQENELLSEIEMLIKDAVSLRLIADTEVASFLSGGIDSSLITSLAREQNPGIRAFTIDLHPEKYSEAKYARILAQRKKINIEQHEVGKNAFQENFETIFKFYDEPFADSSLVPTWLLCKFVSDSNIKCALSGDGADELFYGYNWYQFYLKLGKFKFFEAVLPKGLIRLFSFYPYLKPLSYIIYSSLERYRRVMYNRFTVKEINGLFGLSENISEIEFYEQKMGKTSISEPELNWLDFHTFMVDDILYKVDIASMANSLEVRVPFLDHRLVELMFSILFKSLYKNSELKYLLKRIAIKHIPRENIFRTKKGFSAPVMKWIGKDFMKEIENGALIKSGYLNKNYLSRAKDLNKSPGKLWQLYTFEKWFTNYVFV